MAFGLLAAAPIAVIGGPAVAVAAPTGAVGLAPAALGTTGGAALIAAPAPQAPKPKVRRRPVPRHKSAVRRRPAARPKPAVRRRPAHGSPPARRRRRPTRARHPLIHRHATAPAPPPAPNALTGAAILAYAERFTSTPYLWGGNGPDRFDCSGFTSYVFSHFGYHLSRSSYDQMREGVPVTGALQVGDLVFWDGGGHVGIYAGHDSFISATVHRGIWTYSFTVWRQTQTYTTARRIIGDAGLRRAAAASAAAAQTLPRNGGPLDATP